jgi:hypothetical protein
MVILSTPGVCPVSDSGTGTNMQVDIGGRPEQENVTSCGVPLAVNLMGEEFVPATTVIFPGDGALKTKDAA